MLDIEMSRTRVFHIVQKGYWDRSQLSISAQYSLVTVFQGTQLSTSVLNCDILRSWSTILSCAPATPSLLPAEPPSLIFLSRPGAFNHWYNYFGLILMDRTVVLMSKNICKISRISQQLFPRWFFTAS